MPEEAFLVAFVIRRVWVPVVPTVIPLIVPTNGSVPAA